MEMERKLQVVMEQVEEKEKELLEIRSENSVLKANMQGLEKDKTDLETRVVELCTQKKEDETSKEHHGAKKQAEFFALGVKFDKINPIQVAHNGALVDDDEVDAEGGGNHNPEA
ncbi:hypothetical protein PIB30_044477 [Stylosanthes scabra]|uniref:Uncharacterized protein n=1 Tax=Stylosanthes scabra TaxID=79078 RepID=A0ABU6VHR7_9FABA|nr:hypothetical protein [Stylosanthes scabra]